MMVNCASPRRHRHWRRELGLAPSRLGWVRSAEFRRISLFGFALRALGI